MCSGKSIDSGVFHMGAEILKYIFTKLKLIPNIYARYVIADIVVLALNVGCY